MYKQFFLMQKEPFDSHPSPELFYKSSPHQNGWNYLVQGLTKNEPILLVAGGYGAGKTLLCLKLMKLLEKNSHLPSVFVPTPTYNFMMVLEKILVRLGIPIGRYGTETSEEPRLQQDIYDYFENQMDGKKKFVYVVIDDAQEFSYDFINKLRLFASYNFSGHFPIRIVLFAHHSFFKMLEYKKMVAFGQRIKRIYYLKSLGFEETREYIYFRLIHSGATGTPVFDDEAINLIQTVSNGSPRLINNICDNCLLVASSARCNLINQSLVRQAMKTGNLTGVEKIEELIVPAPISQKAPVSAPQGLPPLPDGPMFGKKNTAPSCSNYRQENEIRSEKNYIDERFQNQDRYTNVAQSRGYENQQPGREDKIKDKLENIGSRYGKMSVIIVLGIIIIFLLFYLFNQNQSNEMYNLQGRNEQTIESVPEYLYVVENPDVFKKYEVVDGYKHKPSLYAIKRKDELGLEKKYQPIILMEKWM